MKSGMTAKEKKELIQKRINEGDTRSYNEIAADLELDLWRERFDGKTYLEGTAYSHKSKS